MYLTSTQKLYEKIAQGEISGFIVPAFNIRTLTFDIARALFRAAKKEKTGAFIVELAKSEMKYTAQSPEEYVRNITKAAKEEKFEGPIFIQGDHFKCSKVNARCIKELEKLIKKAIEAGFYNIDIDSSKLPIEENSKITAYFTNFIRKLELTGAVPAVSVGGEVGQIGGKNTTVEEFNDFIKNYSRELKRLTLDREVKPIIKVAVQTGTSHGGIVLPAGKLKRVKEDFDTLTKLSKIAKKYGMAGAVQHGASTLPEKYFSRFPKTGACEIHLATQFQNMIYDSSYFPSDLKEKIYTWLKKKFWQKRKPGDTEEQFIYKFRKRALGPFKKEILNIPKKDIDKICEELEEKFRFFFQKLNVSDTSNLIKEVYSVNLKK